MMSSNSLPLNNQDSAQTDESHVGGDEPIRWETVVKTSGLTQAVIIAGRLQAEGIPARAWQEGAGQAIGLMVGILGTGHVAVPDSFAEKARKILAEIESNPAPFLENDEEGSE